MIFQYQPEPVAERSLLFTQEDSHFDTRLLRVKKPHALLLKRIGTKGNFLNEDVASGLTACLAVPSIRQGDWFP